VAVLPTQLVTTGPYPPAVTGPGPPRSWRPPTGAMPTVHGEPPPLTEEATTPAAWRRPSQAQPSPSAMRFRPPVRRSHRAERRLCAACRWQVLYGRAVQNCQFWGRLSFAVFLASASSTAAPAARAVGALR